MKNMAIAMALLLVASTSPMAFSLENSAFSASAQTIVPAPPPYTYADLAARAGRAPIIASATIKTVAKMGKIFVHANGRSMQRLYVEADLNTLIRGNQALAKRVNYVADVALDSKGRLPKLEKRRVLLFAQPVASNAAALQLIASDAQLDWDAASETRVRAIVTELLKPDAPSEIRDIASAFHAPGTLDGEGETQIFLATASGAPASLAITTAPGEAPRWSAAFGEVVGESAAIPARDTLAWYRLACGLPATISPAAFEGNHADHNDQVMRDYAFVKQQLGACPRTLPPL